MLRALIEALTAKPVEGEAAVREAAAGELNELVDLVARAVRDTVGNGPDSYVPIVAMYADRAVVRRDGRLFAYPYTVGDDNRVTLGTPEEVVTDHRPVGAMREAQGAFLEAADDGKGLRWRIRVIRAGLSGNGNYYPDGVLREAVALFDNARVFAKADAEHVAGGGKSFAQLIGRLCEPVFVEGKAPDTGEVQATLDLLASAGDVPAKLREAHERGMANLFGFSIDAIGKVKVQRGRRLAESIKRVRSVDLIIEPGAGGELLSLIEALNHREEDPDMKLREQMLQIIREAHGGKLPAGLDEADEAALMAAFREATSTTVATPLTEASMREAIAGEVRLVEARAHARAAIAESGLPDIAKAKLRKRFGADAVFVEADVDAAITEEREYLGRLTESGHVRGLGDDASAEGGEDRADKVRSMLDDFFAAKKGGPQSFRECYIEITGDRRVTGELRHCDAGRLREALGDSPLREAIDSTTFSYVLGDSITRRMVADYNTPSMYDVWRRIVNVVPINDFRTQHRTRYGGYGDIPTVAQGAPYTALTSPTDEEATYAVVKRGGTEELTIEAIRNDDVGLVRQIPVKLSRAARRTLSKFVLDFIRTNPTLYDSVAFFHASHNNLGSTALSATTLAAGRLAMMQQTEAGSSDRLGIPPKFLLVPTDLEETAFDLFRRQTNNDTDFVESLQMTVLPVWYWTDANDWALMADPMDIPTIEVGFLDGNEEPELFVQDTPTVGSMFSNDKLTWKLRHIYGGQVVNYRGAYKAVVA